MMRGGVTWSVDLSDFDWFDRCTRFAGPPTACEAFDADADGDLDLLEWGWLEARLAGS